jgi:nucleotide-binding universal stress UspA family protein
MNAPVAVLTDHIAPASRVVSYAAGLAKALAVRLRLLHVGSDSKPTSFSDYQPSYTQTYEALQQLARSQPVRTDVELARAPLPEAVRGVIDHCHPLLLVMGRTSVLVPPEIIVSEAQELLRSAPCSLLVVPAMGWGKVPPRRIAIAADGEPFVVNWGLVALHNLLLMLPTELTVIHASLPQNANAFLAQQALETVQTCGLASHYIPTNMVEVKAKLPADGILQAAQQVQADLIVVLVRQRSFGGPLFHRSVAALLLEQSPLPVLLVPVQEVESD